MAAALSMNQIIHAAVRRDVGRTERALREMRDGDAARAREVRRGWQFLTAQLTDHHQKEDALIWPYLRAQGVDPELLDAMESEHQALAHGLHRGAEACDAVVADPSAANAASAADVVAEAGRVIGGHLDHEERDIEPLTRQHSTDPEWKRVEKGFRGGPSYVGTMMAWLQDGASPEVQASLKETIPAPVVDVASRVFGRRYHREIAPIWR